MVDPVTGAGAIVAWKVTTLATDLLRRMLGPSAEAAGTLLEAEVKKIGERRAQRFAEAELHIERVGREPKPVQMKILHPLLVGAGLEEDEDLAGRWSALIANAAIGDPEAGVLPRFPHILQQLTPVEARLLDYLFEHHDDEQPVSSALHSVWDKWYAEPEQLEKDLGLEASGVALLTANLSGLGLIQMEPTMRISADMLPGGRRGKANSVSATSGTAARLSEFGFRFVRACRAPAPPASSEG